LRIKEQLQAIVTVLSLWGATSRLMRRGVSLLPGGKKKITLNLALQSCASVSGLSAQ
jgi:hypothetical protein